MAILRIAIYPGTFDPVTNGHLDIILRASRLFDKVIIAVAQDNYKNTLFDTTERLNLMRTVTAEMENVDVESFTGLLVDYCMEKGAHAIIRGLRYVSDFEHEFQMALMNKKMDNNLETVFLMTRSEYSFISSSIIKQAASLGGDIQGLVPDTVVKALKEKYV